MDTWSLYRQPATLIPFALHGRSGSVAVYYGPDDDPLKVGFDSLPGLGFLLGLCPGYPVMHAIIEHYAGFGYRTLCGWVQIVTNEYRDRERSAPQRFVSVDLAPAMRSSDSPYACFGNLPAFFDAPCYNLGEHAELKWVADTFLVTVPMRSREEEITWLAGFRWGYSEYEASSHKPVSLLPLEVTGADVWNGHLPFLRVEYSTWKFRSA